MRIAPFGNALRRHQHKISLMRDKRTTTKEFRELVSEVSMLMAYEVTRDLPLRPVDVETPVGTAHCHMIDGKKLVDLMHQYNVGIQIKATYEVKELDEDFFEGQ